MKQELIDKIRADNPRLLDWDNLSIKTLKDPEKPLSQVSKSGVIYGGLEKGSAVYRISDSANSFIIKHHYDRDSFRREVNNISFVNRIDSIAPRIAYSEDENGLIVMEDLGERSLAYLWKHNQMREYTQWCYETAEVLAMIQSYFHKNKSVLESIYGGKSLPRWQKGVPPSEGLVSTTDEILRISRGISLKRKDREDLEEVELDLKERIDKFNALNQDFIIEVDFLHVLKKSGKIRFIDFTNPPLGSIVFQFNIAWHLPERANIVRHYLKRRDELASPSIDHDEFLYLQDGFQLLEGIDWIRTYCREAIEGEHFLTDFEGKRITNYEESETNNLQAMRLALSSHPRLRSVMEMLDGYFSKQLIPG